MAFPGAAVSTGISSPAMISPSGLLASTRREPSCSRTRLMSIVTGGAGFAGRGDRGGLDGDLRDAFEFGFFGDDLLGLGLSVGAVATCEGFLPGKAGQKWRYSMRQGQGSITYTQPTGHKAGRLLSEKGLAQSHIARNCGWRIKDLGLVCTRMNILNTAPPY